MKHSDRSLTGEEGASLQLEESALFAALVMNLVNLAWLGMGKLPHPDTGKSEVDLDQARLFIDQLEMLAGKTKGNLSADEHRLLQEALMSVRLAFVESAEQAGVAEKSGLEATPASVSGATLAASEQSTLRTLDSAEEDAKKKFVKKY